MPVLATSDGVVVYSGRYFANGTIVDLRREDGQVTRYAHLARIAHGITPGAVVHAGQELGEASSRERGAIAAQDGASASF